MPSKSAAQARIMAASAHDAKFAKKVGIQQSVARDFNQADTGTGIRRSGKGYSSKQRSGKLTSWKG